MSALAIVTPADIAARMGRTPLVATNRQEVARTVRAMGIGLTDARKRGGKKK